MFIVFDVDGTLAPAGVPMSPAVSEVLRGLEAAGHTVCLASGKPVSYLEGLCRGAGLGQAVLAGENGCMGLDLRTQRYRRFVEPPDTIRRMEPEVRALLRPGSYHIQPNEAAFTVFFLDRETDALLTDYFRRYEGLEDIRIYHHFDCFDVLPALGEKAGAAAFYRSRRGLEGTETWVFADGENDRSLMSIADRFFAVGDGFQEISERFRSPEDMAAFLHERLLQGTD